MTCGLSGVLAAAVCGGIYLVLKEVYQHYAYYMDTMHLFKMLVENTVGGLGAALILWCIVFSVFFAVFSRKYVRIINNVSYSISQIAEGNFSVTIPESGSDNLGLLTKNVNAAAKKLKTAVESGEFAKTSKDLLIVNVAHDLKTPLTSINGYLGLILQQSVTPEQTRHYAKIAYNKSVHMERLIDDLFEFTQLNFGESGANKVRTDIAVLCSQIVEEFYPIFLENSLEGRLSAKARKTITLCDPDLIARAISNLLNNAVKYGAEGQYVDVEILSDEKNAFIRVINYDSFIKHEELKNIFDTFYRVDKSRTSKGGGSGLGLAIAKNIVELHDGTISCTSSFEKTVFEIILPLAPDLQKSSPNAN